MSETETKVRDDLKAAMRARDGETARVLRGILAACKNRAIEMRVETLDRDEFVAVVKREAKQRAESLDFARKAARSNLIAEHEAALAVVESYLPRQMSEDELSEKIVDIIGTTGATSLGPVMKELTQRYKGQFDGKLASRLAGELLARAAS